MKDRVENRTGISAITESFTQETLSPAALTELSVSYATSFWAGAWKELLVKRMENGEMVQFGTRDSKGVIYPETKSILEANQIWMDSPNWPIELWEKAGKGEVYDVDGAKLEQFWTLDSARTELLQFLQSVEKGGFGGEFILLRNITGDLVGFTAFTVGNNSTGTVLAQKRFPYTSLLLAENTEAISLTLEDRLRGLFSNVNLGTFLDFAIAEQFQGSGFGSVLFDKRLERMVQLGADVIVGRTIRNSPAQYYGNYLARGMRPIALDPANPEKAIFAVRKDEIKPRQKR